MAAPMRNGVCHLHDIGKRCLGFSRPMVRCFSRYFSSDSSDSSFDKRTPQVAMSSDGNTLLCWHPEPEFPYEHTKPMPRNIEQLAEGDSVLKVQYLESERLRNRHRGPSRWELANMFFTTKHQWNPTTEKKYRKVRTPKDRDRL